jgi:alkylation response protein AidB-like acyl-CoA dehydrogenase
MFLAPDGSEIEIADTAAKFLSRAIPLDRLHGTAASPALSAALRADFATLGWFGLVLPEAEGGSGLSAVEHALFYREVGRHCGPVDILAQGLAAIVSMVSGERRLRAALLAGEQGVALAIEDGSTLRLLGSHDAALALQVERDGARLLDVSAIETGARPSLDPATGMRAIARGTPRTVAVSSDGDVWNLGQLGVAAMEVGIAETALALIVDYAKVRETFGRKIGTYQAVRHACADMALRAEAARCQLWSAAAALKERRSDAHAHLDAAKHLANRAAVMNADVDIQLHGGIGITEEHHAPLLLKHSLLLARVFGSKRALLARLLHAELEV